MGHVLSLSDCRDVRLEGTTLHALTQHIDLPEGTYPASSLEDIKNRIKWIPATFPLDQFIGNIDGSFVWGLKYFSKSARNITINGTVLSAELQAEDGSWKSSSIDLDSRLKASDGVITALDVPVLVGVPEEHGQKVVDHVAQVLKDRPDAPLVVVNQKDGKTIFIVPKDISAIQSEAGTFKVATGGDEGHFWHAEAHASITDDPHAVLITAEAEAKAAVFHVAKTEGRPIETFEADIGSVKVGAAVTGISGGKGGMPVYAGVGASINLVDLKASAFDLTLGAGVNTDVGLKDGSLDLHVAGCGFTVGKKVSVSVLGSGFGIDLGRLFGF